MIPIKLQFGDSGYWGRHFYTICIKDICINGIFCMIKNLKETNHFFSNNQICEDEALLHIKNVMSSNNNDVVFYFFLFLALKST